MKRKYRSRIQIMADILKVIQDRRKARLTHILYGANLSYERLKKYLNELIQKGLVKEEKEDNVNYYIITQRGIEFLKAYEKIKKFSEAFGIYL